MSVAADDDDTPAADRALAIRRAQEWLVAEPPQLVETRSGRKVGEAFTRRVEDRVIQLRLIDDFLGGRDLNDLVTRELAATAAAVVEASYSEPLGRRLLSAVAELGQLAGWVAMDAGHPNAARRRYLDGVTAAQAADNAPVAANLLSTLSYQFANEGDPHTAVLLARTALRGPSRTSTKLKPPRAPSECEESQVMACPSHTRRGSFR